MSNLANALTLLRLILIAPIVVLIWLGDATYLWVAFGFYTVACITDVADGYVARSLNQQSLVGRLFDPIADKLLVGACLLVLVAFDHIVGWAVLAALIILLREILVSGLREFLAEIQVNMPVSRAAKWKTVLQMVALGFLIVGDAGPTWLPTVKIGEYMLGVAAVLTIYTGWDYLRSGLLHVGPEAEERRARKVARKAARTEARAAKREAKQEAKKAATGETTTA